MYLSSRQLSSLQEKELALLRVFISLCRQLNLTYYILGGTLLGAVRHGGFIPWDDDIDVGMPRKDYEQFLHKAPALLPQQLFLQTYKSDPEFPANYAKLRDSHTTFLETALASRNIHHGIYIDIFPLDFSPKPGDLFFRAKALLLKLRITDAFPPGNKKIGTRLLCCLSRLCYPSISQAVAQRESLFRSLSEGSHIVNHCGAWGKKETVPAHWYGKGTVLQFEGLEVQAPACYRAWLTQVYGNFETLPPPEQRVSHHQIQVFDPDRPYTAYLGKELP